MTEPKLPVIPPVLVAAATLPKLQERILEQRTEKDSVVARSDGQGRARINRQIKIK